MALLTLERLRQLITLSDLSVSGSQLQRELNPFSLRFSNMEPLSPRLRRLPYVQWIYSLSSPSSAQRLAAWLSQPDVEAHVSSEPHRTASFVASCVSQPGRVDTFDSSHYDTVSNLCLSPSDHLSPTWWSTSISKHDKHQWLKPPKPRLAAITSESSVPAHKPAIDEVHLLCSKLTPSRCEALLSDVSLPVTQLPISRMLQPSPVQDLKKSYRTKCSS